MGSSMVGGGSAAEIPKYMDEYHQDMISKGVGGKCADSKLFVIDYSTSGDFTTIKANKPSLRDIVLSLLYQDSWSTGNPYTDNVATSLKSNYWEKYFDPDTNTSKVEQHKTKTSTLQSGYKKTGLTTYPEPTFNALNLLNDANDGLNTALAQLITSAKTVNMPAYKTHSSDMLDGITQTAISKIKGAIENAILDKVDSISFKTYQGNASTMATHMSRNIYGEITTALTGMLNKLTITSDQEDFISSSLETFRASRGTDTSRAIGKIKAQLANQGGANATAIAYATMMIEDNENKAIAAYETELRDSIFKTNAAFYTNLIGLFVNYKGSIANTAMQVTMSTLGQAINNYSQAITTLIAQAMQSASNLDNIEAQLSDSLTKTLISLYGSVETAKQDKEMLWGIQYASQLLQMIESSANYDLQQEQALLKISAMQSDAYNSYVSLKTDWAARKLTWPIELLQREANILAAPAGAVVNAQNSPSPMMQVASLLGGVGQALGGVAELKKVW